jgi:quercetin 2,3-dioxygenase
VIDVRAAAARFETVQPGITTRHCFSSGSHYDPANIAFGALIALDEHVVEPGAGFARHAHRGVEIVSWVLAGTLRHEDTAGRVELVGPGTALRQSAGSGIVHSERNGSAAEPLRFVQLVVLGDVATPGCLIGVPPIGLAGSEFDVLRPAEPTEVSAADYVHLFVVRGPVAVAADILTTGDSVRIRAAAVTVEGNGELLVWRTSVASSETRRHGHGDDRDS